MQPRHARHVDVERDRGAHTRKPVRHVGDPVGGAAQHDRAIGAALGDRLGGGARIVGVVDRLGAIGSEVLQLPAGSFEPLAQRALQRHTAVIGGQGNPLRHVETPPCYGVRPNSRLTLTPPKPKAFDRTVWTGTSRALGVT